MSVVAERPRARVRWQPSLQAGLAWTASALLIATLAHETPPAVLSGLAGSAIPIDIPDAAVIALLTVLPFIPLTLGLRGLWRAARARRHGVVARVVSHGLRAALPNEYVVMSEYLPRDSGDGEVDAVVVGPAGVFVVEVCEASGDVVCYEDAWSRRNGAEHQRLEESPSRTARWNAARVRNDVASGGFVRTPVEPIVLLRDGRLADAASSSVVVVEGVEGLVGHLGRWNGAALSPQRTQAIVNALSGPSALAPLA